MGRLLRAVAYCLAWVDLWIYARVQAAAHWVQRWFGMTSFRLTAHVVVLLTLIDVFRTLDYWFPSMRTRYDSTLFDVALLSGCLIVQAHWFRAFDTIDKRFRSQPSVMPYELREFYGFGFWLWIALRWIMLPFFFLMCLVPSPLSERVFHEGRVGVLILFLYLMHVLPLPPGESKVTQFIRKLSARPALVPVHGEG